MAQKVFYSWQSDLPNSTNRGFIQQALENAAKNLRNDDSIEVEPVIDRDTQGVPGSPDIARTIFDKISNAAVFICDVSIINPNRKKGQRATPNPNVLIELGYAIKALGDSRILMIMNKEFGGPDLLPFDLKNKLVITYEMTETNPDKASERKNLESRFISKLKEILLNQVTIAVATPPLSIAEQALEAINNSRPNQTALVKRYMEWLSNELNRLAPDFASLQDNELDDALISSLQNAISLVSGYTKLVEVAVTMRAGDAIRIIYKGFSGVLKFYSNKRGFSGHSRTFDHDFYKFIGHELFVTLFSFLIQEESWDTISNLLDDGIFVENIPDGTSGLVPFVYLSEYIKLLDFRNDRLKLGRASLHADILKERHSNTELSDLVGFDRFMDADVFLYFCSKSREFAGRWKSDFWRPWTVIYAEQYVPQYLHEAESKSYAMKLLNPFKLQTVEELRVFLIKHVPKLSEIYQRRNYFFRAMSSFDPYTLGTL